MAAFTEELEEENRYRELEKMAVKIENQAEQNKVQEIVANGNNHLDNANENKSENSKILAEQPK